MIFENHTNYDKIFMVIYMQIKKATINQVKHIYNQYIIYDFPVNERRPLNKIINLINDNKYIIYVLFKDNTIIGYAFLYGYDNRYICDYFAIVKGYRNNHYGSYFLKELLKIFKQSQIYFEVEKPDEPNKAIKEKRIQFYLNNGVLLNPIHVRLYYVDYIILSNVHISIKDIQQLYYDLYDSFFYKKYIEFK